MTSNYPPGVTGNERPIAGPQAELGKDVTCATEDATIYVLPRAAYTHELGMVQGWILNAATALPDEAAISRLAEYMDRLANSLTRTDVAVCPFVGKVDVEQSWAHGVMTETWTCPLCGQDHEEEFTSEDFE